MPHRHPHDHFINMARDVETIDGPACLGDGGCVLSGIERDIDILKDSPRSNEDRSDFSRIWNKNTITYRVVDTLQANTTRPQEITLVGGEPWRWAAEAYEMSREPAVLYCMQKDGLRRYSDTAEVPEGRAPRTTQEVTQDYLVRFAPVAERRPKLAGFRPVHILNSALGPGYAEPVQNSTQEP